VLAAAGPRFSNDPYAVFLKIFSTWGKAATIKRPNGKDTFADTPETRAFADAIRLYARRILDARHFVDAEGKTIETDPNERMEAFAPLAESIITLIALGEGALTKYEVKQARRLLTAVGYDAGLTYDDSHNWIIDSKLIAALTLAVQQDLGRKSIKTNASYGNAIVNVGPDFGKPMPGTVNPVQ
jgi:hypothetical protein